MFNFDQQINRYQTASVKWDELESRFGDKDLLPMWVADMDFMSPAPVIQAMKQRVEHGIFGYTTRSESYYEAIMEWMEKKYNWTIQEDWICYSPGIVPGLSYIIQTYTEEGDQILVQPPIYHPFINIARNLNREVVFNPLKFEEGRYTLDFEDLTEKLKSHQVKLLLFCSPHNPIGRVWTPEELEQLGKICIEHNVLVISDEVHADLVFPGYTHTPFAKISEDFAQHSLVCTSPSKTFNLAGLQTGNIIIPNAKLREAFTATMDKLALRKTNTFGVVATEHAYKYGAEWLDSLMHYLQGNLQFLLDFIKKQMPEIKAIKPEATYLVWLDFRELTEDSQELERLLIEEAKVALNQGYIFGPEQDGFARINIACPQAVLKEGLERIKQAVDNYKNMKME